ncbi:MAG: fasciclin domain-containing protein [Trueperaceae bacterium]|nr:fasciclin domain-containing protein [Trueperaceae bacterium]
MKKGVVLLFTAFLFGLGISFAQDSDQINVQAVQLENGSLMGYLTANATNPNTDTNCYAKASNPETSYNCLVGALQKTGLDKALADKGSFTLFAPTDQAFKVYATAAGETAFHDLVNSPDTLSALLKYHVLPKAFTLDDLYYMASGLNGTTTLPTLEGQNLAIHFSGNSGGNTMSSVTLGSAHALAPTMVFNNGNLISIDDVVALPAS